MSDINVRGQFLQILGELPFFSQIEALNEIQDFIDNGYMIFVRYLTEDLWLVKMKHKANGNRISVRWKRGEYAIFKNSHVVKTVTVPDELISD